MLPRKLPQILFETRQERKQEKGREEGGKSLRFLGLDSVFLCLSDQFEFPSTSPRKSGLSLGSSFSLISVNFQGMLAGATDPSCGPRGSVHTGTLFFNHHFSPSHDESDQHVHLFDAAEHG